ncbi:MAG: UDP-N-acetylglucosamine 2-epimerase (non-hydrolyzing) [Armatimonadetes bacterium]|nr:UDP-N-acetylglucosamine 2-epimerase (non-hydrolyzing) [Armatimonadota bacterium]
MLPARRRRYVGRSKQRPYVGRSKQRPYVKAWLTRRVLAVEILHVVGARPNFMKAAPVLQALSPRPGVVQTLVHTGQHYDANMSGVFFDQLGMPRPDVNLDVGSGSHAWQTAEIMMRIEPVLEDLDPDWLVVYGDINSTVAASLVAAKLGIGIAHVEAGLRSFDLTMPEEINRMVTDRLANLLLTPSADGDENLLREGVPADRIRRVGNTMIDTLVRLQPKAEAMWPEVRESLGLTNNGPYALVTLHRPSNVDEIATLRPLLDAITEIGERLTCVFPVHPRTRSRLGQLGFRGDTIRFVEPQGYLQFLALQKHACVVVTDSGGIQEETTYLGVPCLTVRENTERPVTITEGTNTLVGRDTERLRREVIQALNGHAKPGRIPDLWDGHAGERIADALCEPHRGGAG